MTSVMPTDQMIVASSGWCSGHGASARSGCPATPQLSRIAWLSAEMGFHSAMVRSQLGMTSVRAKALDRKVMGKIVVNIRPLTASTERIADLPDLPTIAESGYPDYAVSVWYGIAAPSKVPDEIAGKIKASLDRALNDEVFRASLVKIGFPPLRAKSQAEIDKFVDTDRARWAGVVKALNISLD